MVANTSDQKRTKTTVVLSTCRQQPLARAICLLVRATLRTVAVTHRRSGLTRCGSRRPRLACCTPAGAGSLACGY
jgi:hypothetical protein